MITMGFNNAIRSWRSRPCVVRIAMRLVQLLEYSARSSVSGERPVLESILLVPRSEFGDICNGGDVGRGERHC